jgi:hypothetical protein
VEHILNSETGGIDFDRFRVYVESIRNKLPEHVYAFSSNPGHFNLGSRSSLHDAWLETLTVRETASGERKQIRQLEIQVCLFGPHHDRWIHLNYRGITQYSLHTPPQIPGAEAQAYRSWRFIYT